MQGLETKDLRPIDRLTDKFKPTTRSAGKIAVASRRVQGVLRNPSVLCMGLLTHAG